MNWTKIFRFFCLCVGGREKVPILGTCVMGTLFVDIMLCGIDSSSEGEDYSEAEGTEGLNFLEGFEQAPADGDAYADFFGDLIGQIHIAMCQPPPSVLRDIGDSVGDDVGVGCGVKESACRDVCANMEFAIQRRMEVASGGEGSAIEGLSEPRVDTFFHAVEGAHFADYAEMVVQVSAILHTERSSVEAIPRGISSAEGDAVLFYVGLCQCHHGQ